MQESTTTMAVLQVSVQPEHEEQMVDYLIQTLPGVRFSSQMISLHGQPEGGLSLREQVLGTTRRCLFSVQAEAADLQALAAGLGQGALSFPVEYRVLPLLLAGQYTPATQRD
ncbi:DUF3240 family protein [Methylovorus glucosotrophus]|uniref:DUF3240 domain-containing protein n=1 Tax=Methylovorus glucosotrophus (strain SIP3-4) TaxID=582744 RepID=C6X7I1_METGS|nr:DUF3240 family protein [Methylovorus glucosotrophus]ACT51446.1 conserved hypothetical protein [Methylovorus glucosotrophus SIP3-4]KAF0843313.1 uncharacterized protein DUF3240 [Methylovorus glucosotrophus]